MTTAETAQLVADGKGKMELHKIHIDAEFKFTMAYTALSPLTPPKLEKDLIEYYDKISEYLLLGFDPTFGDQNCDLSFMSYCFSRH